MATPYAMQCRKMERLAIALVLAAAATLAAPGCASASAGSPGSRPALTAIAGPAMTDNQLAQARGGSEPTTGTFFGVSPLQTARFFAVFAIFKFKQHKGNPRQVPIRGPFGRVFGTH